MYSLRRRVVDRVRLPRPGDLLAAAEIYGDSTRVAAVWKRYADPYLNAASGVTSPYRQLLRGHDRAALEVLRLVDRMLWHYLGDD